MPHFPCDVTTTPARFPQNRSYRSPSISFVGLLATRRCGRVQSASQIRAAVKCYVMLLQVTKAIRIRAALVLAILFGVCIIAPSLGFAFADSRATAHCLTDNHHGTAKSQKTSHDHDHGQAESHNHSDLSQLDTDQTDNAAPGSCCGLFCLTALSAAHSPAFGPQLNASSPYPALQDAVTGGQPGRINRPPIVSLPM